MPHFKNVLHRALWVKSHGGDPSCRCCRSPSLERENLQHFAHCAVVSKVFMDLARVMSITLSNMREREWFSLFLETPNMRKQEEGWVNLHLVLWKYVIAALVRVDTEDEKFAAHDVWQATLARIRSKILARYEGVLALVRRADARGETAPDVSSKDAPFRPLASIGDEGVALKWNKEVMDKLFDLSKPPQTNRKRKTNTSTANNKKTKITNDRKRKAIDAPAAINKANAS